MSAKGLPPAVRLDPIPIPHPIAFPKSHHNQPRADTPRDPFCYNPYPHPYLTPSPHSYPSRSLDIHTHNNQVITQTKTQGQTRGRGLTPIIITPTSSRSHTPVGINLEPIVPVSAGPGVKVKLEPKVEKVELEPLRPMAVDKPDVVPTDIAMAETGEGGGGQGDHPQAFQYTSPRAGRTITFPQLQFDQFRLPINTDTRGEERAEEVVERGRPLTRVGGRFREKNRGRHKPYDPNSRPNNQLRAAPTEMNGSTQGHITKTQIQTLPQTQTQTQEAPRTPTPTKVSPLPPTATTPMPTQQPNPAPTPQPPQLYSSKPYVLPTRRGTSQHGTPPQGSQLSPSTIANPNHNAGANPAENGNGSTSGGKDLENQAGPSKGSRPSRAIHSGADEMIGLFTAELQKQVEREREALKQEREALEKEKEELRREKEGMKKEQGELRKENDALRIRIAQLEAALKVFQERGSE